MKLIAFLAFITSMAWADTNCREQIDCTEIQFYICRKACPEGGFTFTTGGECSSDYEPVLGYCDVKNKKAKFIPSDMAYATMAEGARRAGDQYYRSNPTVVWRCGSSSNGSIPPNFPKTQVLKLKYQRKSYLTVGELDATAINEFLDQLESNFPNYNVTDCLNKLSNELENVVKLACEATDKELNVSKNLFCEQSVIPKLVWKHQARIAKLSRKVKDSQLPYVHVLGLVNGGSNREIEQSVEASINNCSIFSVNDSFVYIEYIRDLKPRVQNLDPTCRKNLLKSIVRFLPSQLRGFCEKEKQHPQCLEIRSPNARLLPELANTFPTEFKQARIHADHLAKIICRKDVNIVGAELLKLMNRVEKINQCVFLQPGQSKVISGPDYPHSNYRLSRLDKKTFQAEINFDFHPAVYRKDMEIRVEKCFDKTKSYFKFPNGEKLILKSSNSNQVPTSKVRIVPESNYRSNSANWKIDISCEVIIHESLHLLGLVDEYHETSYGYAVNKTNGKVEEVDNVNKVDRKKADVYLGSSCRAYGPTFSVMHNQNVAFEKANHLFSNDPVLLPAHYNVITAPGCSVLNEKYYLCSSFSYQSKFYTGCHGKPRYCDNWKDWLGSWD